MNESETGKISEALRRIESTAAALWADHYTHAVRGKIELLRELNSALPLAQKLEARLARLENYIRVSDEKREQLEAEVVSLRAELEQANKRIETLRQESQSHADTIREMVPSYMKYWAPLSAVEILCKEQEKLRAELEQERIQHAGCLTAAEGWAKDPPKKGDWAWSPAFQAALDLRAQVEQLTADKARLDWLQAKIDPAKQAANGGFVVQTLEIRNNHSMRQSIDNAMKKSQ